MRRCYICDKRKARDSEEKIPVCNMCANQYSIEFDIILVDEPELVREEIITEEIFPDLPELELDFSSP